MSDEKTMKLVTNLDRAAIEAKLREIGGDAAAAGLTDIAKMFIGIERVSATLGARVAIAESGRFGGTCVNVGCIPKKLFSYAAHFRDELKDAADFGWRVAEPELDWPTLLANKDREIDRLNGVYERVLVNAGVFIFRGKALVRGKNEVEVNGRNVTAKHILIATG